jgi:anti-sigma factor RsiW
MDDATVELLSRAIDDDLDPRERGLCAARLQADPDLERQLAGLAETRRWVAMVAESMAPPEILDALMKPLRLAAAPARSPASSRWRWLGVAATAVLALLVGHEIGSRGRPRAPLSALANAARTPGADTFVPFQLRPLPTRSGPESEELLGVAEHLLAATPRAPGPAPADGLVVIGPSLGAEDVEPPPEPRLVLRVGDGTYHLPFQPLAVCGGLGHWPIGVVVDGGKILEVIVDDQERGARSSCSRRLHGLETPGLRDGSYSGEVVTGVPD